MSSDIIEKYLSEFIKDSGYEEAAEQAFIEGGAVEVVHENGQIKYRHVSLDELYRQEEEETK